MNKERWLILFLVVALLLIILVAFIRYPRDNEIERDIQRLESELSIIENQMESEFNAIEQELEEIKNEL